MNKIIHTSDWHLGQRLERQERADEQQAFLTWLLEEMARQSADALLVCGDIFDVANPPIDAVRMLYAFLAQARRLCRNIVLTAGNHDSGARLDAIAALATELGITIVGRLPDDPAGCLVPLMDRDGRCFAQVAAVPYLRPGDLSTATADEDVAAQHGRILTSIEALYAAVLAAAEAAVKPEEALLVTGHLFARGGKIGEGERAAHVEAGNLLAVPTAIFGGRATYVALGHLHRCQRVAKNPPTWYSGTPIPLSFGEAEGEQSIQLISVTGGEVSAVEAVPVPRTRELYDVVGERGAVFQRLEELVVEHPPGAPRAWLRVAVVEETPEPGMRDAVGEAVADSSLHLLAVQRVGAGAGGALADAAPERRLDELSPEKVFEILHEERFDAPPEAPLADAFAQLLQEVLTGEDAT